MKTKKRLLATLLTLAMVFSMLPMGALAETVTEPPVVTETTVQAPVGPQDPGADPRAETDVCKLESSSVSDANKNYTSFAAAITAANASSTACKITLLADCTYAGDSISKPLTIEGDNKTLTLSNGNDYAYINVVGDMVIKNLTIKSEVPDGKADVFHVKSKLTMTNCTVTTTNKAENGMFNIANNGKLTLVSGTYTTPAGGKITSGASFEMKTGDGAGAVTIVDGTIQLNKDKFITLSAGSTAPTTKFNIQTAADAADGNKIVECSTDNNTLATALAAKITVNGDTNTDFTAQVATNDITLKRTDNNYVKLGATAGNGTFAKPYGDLSTAYTNTATTGEIRLLSNLDATEATTFGTADKTVTVTSYTDAATQKADGGWTVKRGSAFKGEMLKVTDGTVNLNHITLDGNKGTVTDATAPLMSVAAGKTLTLDTGATLQNNKTTGNGGAVVTAGTVNMHDGAKITGNEATAYGSAVYVHGGGSFVMDGGEISGNKTTAPGGSGTIMIATESTTGTVEIKGTALIQNNEVPANGSAIHGGNVGSTIKIGGTATITSNKRTGTASNFKGCAIFPYNGTVTLDGAPTIIGNTDKAGKPTNVLLCLDNGTARPFVIGTLTGGSIGVTGPATNITTETAVATDANYVHSDDINHSVTFDTNKLTLTDGKSYYVSDSGSSANDGSYEHPFKYLQDARDAIGTTHGTYNVHIIGTVQGSASKYLVDGDVHATAGQLKALNGQTVNLIGESSAKIIPTAGNSAVLYVGTGATMTATNVELKGFDSTFATQAMGAADSAVVYVDANGSFTMKTGASIQDNYNTCTPATPGGAGAGWAGGSVYVKGTLNMETGSLITGGNGVNGYNTYSGGVVINGGTLNMTGGEISGNKGAGGAGVYVDGNGNINLSGTPIVTGNESNPGVANNIYLANGRVIKLTGELSGTANVGVYTQSLPGEYSPVVIAVQGGSYLPKATDAAFIHSDNASEASVQFGTNNIVLAKATQEVYVSTSGLDTNNGTAAFPYKTLAYAYSQVSNGGTIKVMDNLEVAAQTVFNGSNKAVTITSCKANGDAWAAVGDTHTVKRVAGLANKTAFIVSAGSVTLENIIFDGGATWSSAAPADLLTRANGGVKNEISTDGNDIGQLFTVNAGGALTLDSGAVLQNNDRQHSYPRGGDRGSAVYVNSGKLTMNNGASIKNNRVCNAAFDDAVGDGAAVAVWYNGQFHMNGGTISGNTAGRMGGAIRIVTDSGTQADMYMSGGTISGNATKSTANGGGISVHDGILHLSGAPVVTGNLHGATIGAAVASNISFVASHLVMDGRLSGAANIGLWASGHCDVTNATATYNDLQYFHSDTLDLAAQFKDNKIVLATAATDTYVSNSGNDLTGDGTQAKPYATIARAYVQAANNGKIHVMTDLTVPATTLNADKTVTILGEGGVHTLTRGSENMLLAYNGTVKLQNITITDRSGATFTGAPVCVNAPGTFTMGTGATIQNTKSHYAAVYMFSGTMTMESGSTIKDNTNSGNQSQSNPQQGHGGGVYVSATSTLSMTGGTITGNKCTVADSRGGAVYAVSGAHFNVQGDVKIFGNTTTTSVGEGVYLKGQNLEVTGNLATTAHIDLGVNSNMAAGDSYHIGTASGDAATSGTAANLSAIVAAPATNPNLVAVRNGTTVTKIQWAAADTNWLDWVAHADQSYGWKDSNTNLMPDGIPVNTPAKLYSLAYAIRENYSSNGASYANGAYKLTADLDLSGFAWQPIGITGKAFTGVFEGEGVHTITGISHKAGLTENGIFGVVAGPGARTGASWVAPYDKTLIQNVTVDGGGKIWNSTTTTHMGGIAAKATDATIQNCTVKNLSLKISDTANHVFAGGIVGETTTCQLLNNSVVHIGKTAGHGAPMALTADAGNGNWNSHAGGIVGKATGTEISGNTVGGNDDHYVEILTDSSDNTAAGNYAGGVVGYMDGGSIDNETYAHLNAMNVIANSANNNAYAGGVAGFLAGAATMTNCTPGANGGEMHFIVARRCSDSYNAGSNYAGGLVGGMSGTSSITNSTIGASGTASYTVNAGVGTVSVAGGLVGTMAAGTSLTDCTISGDSIDSVKVTAAGIAGGLVGTAMDARVIKCNAQNITIAGSKASGGLAGTFKAGTLATTSTANAPGVMAMCYERNCYVTEITAGQGSYCDMIQTAEKALILACYASKNAPRTPGIYAVKDATGSKFVGCYTTANQANKFAVTGGIFDNCYFIGTDTTCADTDQAVGITAETMKKADGGALTQMNTTLQTTYDTVTGNLRMGYMAGQSAQMNGNYNYPVYAVWLLTVNSLPSSVYGTYTVTADSKPIATNATGFNQYWVGKDAKITITGDPDDYYATADAATFTITKAAGAGTDSGAITNVVMNKDKTATVTFTPKYFPGWTINGTHSNNATIYSDASIKNGTLGIVTDNKLAGNTVKNWERDASNDWATPANARTIKTIFVTAATATPGASNPTISAFTADGWTVATGGVGKAYVQLTNAQGANATAVSAIVNSFAFAAEKTATGDVEVKVQVYVDENIRGAMYFFGGSVYELAGSAVGQPAAKALAENSTLGAKKGHLVVIGSSAEHAFLKDNVKTNAWTAAVTSAPSANVVGTWTWDGIANVTEAETKYLQNQNSWAGGEPNNSGTYATYNYTGKFDDTNGANVALIEYDGKTPSAAGWQAYSALASGTVTCHVDVPVAPDPGPNPGPGPDVGPIVNPNPGEGITNPHDNGVSKLLEADKHIAYMKGDDKGNFNPEKGITRAETAQMFYNLLKNKDIGEVANFSDVEAAAWYADAVNALAALKIIDGRSADQFAPDDYISRAEFTAIAMRFADSVKGEKAFTDVPTDYWAESYIAAAAQYGWIDGYGDGTFKPFGNIKRCEAAKIVNTMLWRFADTAYVDSAKNLKTFPDVAKDSWAFYDIMEAANGHDFKQNKTGLETWAK